MKKVLLLLSAAFLAFSCTESEEVTPEVDDNTGDDYAVLTFEDADYLGSTNYVGYNDWSSLIDNYEFGGDLLYAYDADWNTNSEYNWYDENNTELTSEIYSAYWNGGVAVSNYYAAVSEESKVDYDRQLSISYIDDNGNSGYNGSANFAVVSGYGSIYFGDGVAREISSMQVAVTSYWLSVALYGDDYGTPAMTSDDWFKITASSLDSDGATVATTELYLAQGGEIVEGWNSWDLSSLGEVTTVLFTTDSSIANEYGSLLPNYFAVDDITVKL